MSEKGYWLNVYEHGYNHSGKPVNIGTYGQGSGNPEVPEWLKDDVLPRCMPNGLSYQEIHMDERMFSINHNHAFCGDAEVDMEEEFEATEELFKDEEERIGLALEISSRTGIDYTTVMRVLMEEENPGRPAVGRGKRTV